MKTQNKNITSAILTEDGQVMIEQANGSYLPAKKGKTDFARLDAMQDHDINYSEIPELTEEFFKAASTPIPPKKEQLTVRLDSDLLSWLKEQESYNTRINIVLRAYMQFQKNHNL